MKKLILLILLIPTLCYAGPTTPSESDMAEKQYNESQIKILKSKKIIVCYALKKKMFEGYADLDTELACITHNQLGAYATLDEIYSWGFKLIQVVNVPPQTDPHKFKTAPLYYFDKR